MTASESRSLKRPAIEREGLKVENEPHFKEIEPLRGRERKVGLVVRIVIRAAEASWRAGTKILSS